MSPLPFYSHQRASQLSFLSQSKGLFPTSNFPVPTGSLLEPLLQLNTCTKSIKTEFHPQHHHKANSVTKNKNPSMQHIWQRPWEVKTIFVASYLVICMLQAPLENKAIFPWKSPSTSSLPLHFISEEWTAFGHAMFPCDTYLEKAEKGRESSQMLKEPHRHTMGKHGQKNCRNEGCRQAPDRGYGAEHSWSPWTILHVVLLKVWESGRYTQEFSRTKSRVFYRVTPKAQRAIAFTLSIFTVYYWLLLNW